MFADRVFRQYLANTKLVDIGRLEKVYADTSQGLATLFNDAHTQIPVEICLAGGLGIAQAGQCGLVVIAQNNISIADATIDISEPNYSGNYAKFIPLNLAGRSMVALESTGKGVAVGSKNYSLEYGDKAVTLISDKLTFCADVDTGVVNLYTQNGAINLSLTQTALTAQFGPVSAETKDITEIIAKQDELQLHIGEAINITASQLNGISLKSSTITLDGDVSISGSLDVAEGNFTVDK